MKYFPIVLIIILFATGCKPSGINIKERRNDQWVWFVDEKTGDGVWLHVGNEPNALTGKYTRFYFNGNMSEVGRIRLGVNIDTSFFYDLDGKMNSYTIWDDGRKEFYILKDGPHKFYYNNGKIRGEGIASNHKEGDQWVSYYENGNKKFTQNYLRDTGWLLKYYESGAMEDSAYHMGHRDAIPVKSWYENGQLKYSAAIKNGIVTGLVKAYYANGQISDSGFAVNGKKQGIAYGWYERGTLKYVGKFDNDMLDGHQIAYYENGKISADGYAKAGVKDGELKQFDETGKIIKDVIFSDGKIVKKIVW